MEWAAGFGSYDQRIMSYRSIRWGVDRRRSSAKARALQPRAPMRRCGSVLHARRISRRPGGYILKSPGIRLSRQDYRLHREPCRLSRKAWKARPTSGTPSRADPRTVSGNRVKVHRGLGCTPRISRWRAHHAQHRVPHVRRGGAHKAFLKTSGTAAGWKRGRGPSAFFREPHGLPERPGTRHSASPDARSREPSDLTTPAGTRRPSRAPRALKIAHQVFVEAGSRVLPAGIVAGRRWDMEVSSKKIVMAPHCVRTIRATRRPTPDVQPETRKRFARPGECRRRRPDCVGAPSPGSPATRSTMYQR
jgi:hypothetical protein